jgi:hypothetical protein
VATEVPTLTFASIVSQTYGAAAFPVTANSASSGAVTYSVVSGQATISGNSVTLTGTSTVVLGASQAAAGNYTAATTTISFTVAAEVPALAFASIPNKTHGNAPFPVTASSASSGAVTYSVASGPATISVNTVTLTGIGTVVLNASQVASGNYAAATATTSFAVAAEVPTITFASIPSKTYGAGAFPVSATSTSSAAIVYSVVSGPATVSGSVVTITGAGTVVLQASQAASGNYAAGTQTTNFTVAPATPNLAFVPIASPQIYGPSPITVSTTSPSNGAVTYSVVSGPATITGNQLTLTNAGTVELSATQASTTNYTNATATTSFTVGLNVQITAVTPANQSMAPGTQTFIATATDGPTDGITWTASGGTITAGGVWTSPNTAGTYTITATSADESSVSNSTTVTVSKPVITTQPVSQSLCGSATLSLSVAADYATSYQWNFNGIQITSATAASYSTSSATSGNYTVVVTNLAGTVTSSPATVEVGSAITTEPSSLTIIEGQTAGFNVAATGKSPFTYQWYTVPFGGSATILSGATSSQYITPVETSTTSSPVGYYVHVTDACGTVLPSNTADLSVNSGNSPPTITVQPVGQTVSAAATATFSATAVGSGTLTYQWYVIPGAGVNDEITGAAPTTGTSISGATHASYTVPSTSTTTSNDQDVYYVQVSNSYGSAVSQHATLAVGNGVQLQITGQPVNVYANPGAPASFTVTASSTLSLSYQWYEVPAGASAASQTISQSDGSGTTTTTTTTLPASAVVIDGATSPTYTIPAVSSGMNGMVYYVVVTNNQTPSVTSNAASLFVGPPADIPSCSSNWNILGTTTAFASGTCSYQMTAGETYQYGEIVWPTLVSTGNIQLSFTIATSNTSSTPADGFAMVLGDPSLGATLTSAGEVGEGLGARGISGFVLAFDDFYNAACTSSCDPAPFPADPSSSSNPDYLGVGRGETSLWESPYFNVNKSLPVQPGDTSALAESGKTISNSYVVSIVNGYMSVTMNGTQAFSGNVSVPPVAYLYVTASTGGSYEQTVISNISATVSAPSN